MGAPATGQEMWQAILNAEPALAALFPRQPAYRYFPHNGWRYCWTTERMGDGKFAAFVYRPVGAGSRSGKARSFKLTREVRFKTRKAAKARADKWLTAAEATP